MRARELRAWDKNKKEWVSPAMVDYEGLELPTLHWSLKPLDDHIEITEYTGIEDVNGNKIFEGDILEFVFDEELWGDSGRKTTYCQVVFKNGCFGELSKEKGRTYFTTFEEITDSDVVEDSSVVGNIYENPELLENKV